MSQNTIEQGQANLSIQQSSDYLKKQTDNIVNIEEIQNDVVISPKGQSSIDELQTLRKQNKNLKAIRQAKLQRQKSLNLLDTPWIGQKFFKLTTCLLAEKLQKQMKSEIKSELQEVREPLACKYSFDEVIEHVLNSSQPFLEYSKYALTAKIINDQQTDYDFMVRRGASGCSGENIGINNY